jgi:hypothetical protein
MLAFVRGRRSACVALKLSNRVQPKFWALVRHGVSDSLAASWNTVPGPVAIWSVTPPAATVPDSRFRMDRSPGF